MSTLSPRLNRGRFGEGAPSRKQGTTFDQQHHGGAPAHGRKSSIQAKLDALEPPKSKWETLPALWSKLWTRARGGRQFGVSRRPSYYYQSSPTIPSSPNLSFVSASRPTTRHHFRWTQQRLAPALLCFLTAIALIQAYYPKRAVKALSWSSTAGYASAFACQSRPWLWGCSPGADIPLPDSMRQVPEGPWIEGNGVEHGFKLPPPRPDGRLLVKEGKPHPIYGLMRNALRQWKSLQGRQSKSFREAVAEYKRRHGRPPPKGFDKWYAFAKANHVLLLDEFDLISKDLHLYRAFRPSVLRDRVEHLLSTFETTWTIRIEKGQAFREGTLRDHDRARGVVNLIQRFAKDLPDMKIAYNGHDGARIGVAAEERERLESLIQAGQYDDTPHPFQPKLRGPFPHWGMDIFCPSSSAIRSQGASYGWPPSNLTGLEMPAQEPGSIGTLIQDFRSYMDVCNSPQYRHFHATTSWVYSHHPPPIAPLFTPGVQQTFADVHSIITEQLEVEPQSNPWENRPFTALLWRGQTSGPLWESTTPWRTTQRSRLHLLSHAKEGDRAFVTVNEDGIAKRMVAPNHVLNPTFLNTGMVGPAVQCIKEDGTCDEMERVFEGYDDRVTLEQASLYKFVLDVDGNSWSGRFRRLMMSNAAVIKATIFPEFWTDWAIPWLHFIPMQVDYSDMWDILAFFRGDVEGRGAHDDLAQEIAKAGQDFVRRCYRWQDLEAFQFRLMLEYARLYNDEETPGANDFTGDDSIEPVWEEL